MTDSKLYLKPDEIRLLPGFYKGLTGLRFYPYEYVYIRNIIFSCSQKERIAEKIKTSVIGKDGIWINNPSIEPDRRIIAMDNKITISGVFNGKRLFFQFYDGDFKVGLSIIPRNYPTDTFIKVI